ncbi:MAG: hypothetical protein RJA25_331 [Bacteroidota bacterium]|jgi:large subunit ribosomal protein L17
MRHGNKINHLGRKYGHRAALLKNLSAALFMNKRIETTIAKAKELRGYVEPLITKAKDNTTHSRRQAFSYLQDKTATKELFDVVAPKVGDRPGGYTRIVRLGFRLGDAAEMAIIELVDFNETYKPKATAAAEPKKKTRRSAVAKKKTETAEVVEESNPTPSEPEITPTEEKTEE